MNKIEKLLVITPVKNSIQTTECTVRAVMQSQLPVKWHYVVYDDFSEPECAARLDELTAELGFEVVHLRDLTDTPSPNYRFVLQLAQKRALEERTHLVILESDVEVRPDTLQKLYVCAESQDNAGMVAAVTIDENNNVNFPYRFAHRWKKCDRPTRKRFSFCCTLLTNKMLKRIDFHQLDPSKQWYDVTISHQSIELGFSNILMMTNPVIHRPHSSRPWKLLKYTNPLKYYWIKYTRKLDRI